MVKLNSTQETKLKAFQYLAEERHTLKRIADEAKAKVEEEIYEDWHKRMEAAVTELKREEVPNRRIGLAWGTTNQADAKKIVERYNKVADQTTTPGATAPDTADPTVAITGTPEAPLLTLTNWRAHATTQTKCMDGSDTPVLNLTEEPLRLSQSGRWYMIDKRDGVHMVTQRELANPRSELQQTVTEAVNAL